MDSSFIMQETQLKSVSDFGITEISKSFRVLLYALGHNQLLQSFFHRMQALPLEIPVR